MKRVWIEEKDNVFFVYIDGWERGQILLKFQAYERAQAEVYKKLLIKQGYIDEREGSTEGN